MRCIDDRAATRRESRPRRAGRAAHGSPARTVAARRRPLLGRAVAAVPSSVRRSRPGAGRRVAARAAAARRPPRRAPATAGRRPRAPAVRPFTATVRARPVASRSRPCTAGVVPDRRRSRVDVRRRSPTLAARIARAAGPTTAWPRRGRRRRARAARDDERAWSRPGGADAGRRPLPLPGRARPRRDVVDGRRSPACSRTRSRADADLAALFAWWRAHPSVDRDP